mmetsp:Transcript_13717/g.18838  ORF Transcript_13717/g.18838 Transcript_13717/m.18838 type:complete len:365 (+) Transcript_13717:193-1287(+)
MLEDCILVWASKNAGFCSKATGSSAFEKKKAKFTCQANQTGFLDKLGRVIKEKAQADIDRVFKGTSKTREKLGIVDELLTYWKLDESDDLLEELEDALISADFGPTSSLKIVDAIREKVLAGKLKNSADVRGALKVALKELISQRAGDCELKLVDQSPNVIMIVGVNGGGKTTTIGKLAHRFTKEGAKVMVAAGDTFRAAASEQLETWADRSGAELTPFQENMKPSAVLYKAVEYASREDNKADILLADTSGRLHTNSNLMLELVKCKQAISKAMPTAPHEILLVLDGTTGLNMLNQAREFNKQMELSGLILTKLDGTSRGGCVVSVIDELGLPVKFVGVGEGLEDLQPFDANIFVDSLFPDDA